MVVTLSSSVVSDFDTFSRLHDTDGCHRVHVFIFLPVRSCFGKFELVCKHTLVSARACVTDHQVMATEIRRFLPSNRVVHGLDIVSVSMNFFSVPRTTKWYLWRSGRGDEQTGHMVTPRKNTHSSLKSLSWVIHPPCHSPLLSLSSLRVSPPFPVFLAPMALHRCKFGPWTLMCLPTNNRYRLLFTLICCYSMCLRLLTH